MASSRPRPKRIHWRATQSRTSSALASCWASSTALAAAGRPAGLGGGQLRRVASMAPAPSLVAVAADGVVALEGEAQRVEQLVAGGAGSGWPGGPRRARAALAVGAASGSGGTSPGGGGDVRAEQRLADHLAAQDERGAVLVGQRGHQAGLGEQARALILGQVDLLPAGGAGRRHPVVVDSGPLRNENGADSRVSRRASPSVKTCSTKRPRLLAQGRRAGPASTAGRACGSFSAPASSPSCSHSLVEGQPGCPRKRGSSISRVACSAT